MEIQQTSNYSLLPILADMLEDVGYNRWYYLTHLREDPHSGPCSVVCYLLEDYETYTKTTP